MLTFALFLPFPGTRAQDPVVKPRLEPLARLPAPSSVAARQLPDGRIEVRWSEVAGAIKYQLTRSVPPNAAQLVTPDPVTNVFIDDNVRAGSTYYYTVAAYSSEGVIGLKAGSSPVTAMISVEGTSTTSARLAAALVAPNRIHVSWPPPSGATTGALLERTATTASGTATASLGRVPLAAGGVDDLFDLPGATQISYRLVMDTGAVATSNTVTLGGVLSPDPTPGGSTTTAVAAPPGATFTAAPAVSLRAGATSSLGTMGGTGARWFSMNEAIATVDSSGVVTAVAAGTAHVVALSTGGDGSLRVTSIAVVVNP